MCFLLKENNGFKTCFMLKHQIILNFIFYFKLNSVLTELSQYFRKEIDVFKKMIMQFCVEVFMTMCAGGEGMKIVKKAFVTPLPLKPG